MESENEITKNAVTISESTPITHQTDQIYLDFVKGQNAIVQERKKQIDTSISTYTDSPQYKSYVKALEHAAVLGDGGRLIRSITKDTEIDTTDCFCHMAKDNQGTIVGFEITSIRKMKEGRIVDGEFIGVAINCKDPTTPEKLLLARHTRLIEMGINTYEARMLKRSAKILERRGFKLKFLEKEGNDDLIASYKFDLT